MSNRFREEMAANGVVDFSSDGDSLLLRMYPFYDLDSPGMPPAGPDFVDAAQALSNGQRGEARRNALKRHLSYLYYRALYDDTFSLRVRGKQFRSSFVARFIPGHWWKFDVEGPRASDVMLVGKAPGREEDKQGRHFCGPTGKLLEEVINLLRIPNSHAWYVTNICRFYCPASRTEPTLPASWVKDCAPLLHQELRLVRPKYLVLLGNEAISAVFGRGKNYKNTNGRVIPYRVPIHRTGEPESYHDIGVITSIHPAAVLRDPARRDDLVSSFRMLKQLLDNQSSQARSDPESDREHLLVENAEQLDNLVRRLRDENVREFAIDTEFEGNTPLSGSLVTIQFSWAPKKAAVVSLRDENLQPCFGGGLDKARELLSSLFLRKDARIIMHYALADLWWLKSFGLDLTEQFSAPVDDPDPDGVERFFGWQKTAWEGGFDTMLAAHACDETADFSLKNQAVKYTTIRNYESAIEEWKKQEAKRRRVSADSFGYGHCPRNILNGVPAQQTPFGTIVRDSYSACDADATFRLFRIYNSHGGLLDCDRFGNNCRMPFWISMRACLAFYEMHETGMVVDVSRAEELMDLYNDGKEFLLSRLRKELNWPDFNPNSPIHCREALFGEQYNGKVGSDAGACVSVRPAGALSLYLTPYKSTGRRSKLWKGKTIFSGEESETPATDKETLEVLKDEHVCVKLLRDYRYLSQVLRYVLKPPSIVLEGDKETKVYDEGLLSYIEPGGRVHTKFSQTKETGRASSWRPPLQNLSKKRETDYKSILGANYKYPLRSIFIAPPGHVLVSADYSGAELLGMAIQARDAKMIQDCKNSGSPSSGFDENGNPCDHGEGCRDCTYPHPDYYDIHSNVAIRAFRPTDKNGVPLRKGCFARFDLSRSGLDHLRDAAKPVVFGYAYGMTSETAYRRAKEMGVDISEKDAEALIESLEREYPGLVSYYAEAENRVLTHRWISNCFGRYRRTYPTSDASVIRDLQRQFRNFPIQSLVADAVSLAMANFLDYRKKHGMKYRLVLQVHDEIIAQVPIDEVEKYYYEAIPYCMSELVSIWPCDFSGNVIPDPNAPYHLIPGRSVFLRWGETLTVQEARKHGIPESVVAD